MSETRIICEGGCGFPRAFCRCAAAESPESRGERPDFSRMRDDFVAQETILPDGDWLRQIHVTDGSDAAHVLNAFVGFLTRRFAAYVPVSLPPQRSDETPICESRMEGYTCNRLAEDHADGSHGDVLYGVFWPISARHPHVGRVEWSVPAGARSDETPETIRCAGCGRECEPIADDDSPVTHCVECAGARSGAGAEETMPDYAAAARSIAFNLSEFCDTSLNYPDMIAVAARKASAEVTTLRAQLAEARKGR